MFGSILIFLFIFVLVILLLGLSIIGTVFRAIFGLGRRTNNRPYNTTANSASGSNTRKETLKKRKKVFEEDEGEYVEFEEVEKER